jgi:hypothetical protein
MDAVEAASKKVSAIMAQRDANLNSSFLNQDPAFELGSTLERWYDVEASCCINKELPPSLDLKYTRA